MKKIILSSIVCCLAGLYAAGFDTDVSVFSELCSAYNSGFYPGAVQCASKLEKEFPDSLSLGEALLIKGESLVRLNQAYEAENVLEKALKLNESNSKLSMRCLYWLGRSYDLACEYSNAQKCYFEYTKTSGSDAEYYPSAILNAGRIYFREGEYEKALPLFEYVVQNGQNYPAADYADGLLKYMDSCNRTGKSKKSISLYKKITKEDFEKLGLKPYFYYLIQETAGEAFEINKEYKKAYELYCEVLKSGDKAVAANALKKAYNVSSLHKSEVGADAGSVLAEAQKALADSPELLGEFWTRLGADAYEAGDFKKAISYFDEAEKNVSVEYFLFAALYRAQIIAGLEPDVQSAGKAEEMILASRGILNEENSGIWKRESYILLVRYAAIQGKWNEVIKYAEEINPVGEETKNYLALAYYFTGDYQKSNAYLKGEYIDLHGITLAKTGDLKNAAFIYSGIEENRKLTDEELLNYAKVLLISGRYREAQLTAAKCGLNEAKYILGLAQFNTWSWPYAEENFSSYLKSRERKNPVYEGYARFYLGYSQYRQGKTKDAYLNLSDFIRNYSENELYWNALMAAANSAVQNGNNSLAVSHAELAVALSKNDSDREDSVLLCADIYSDLGKINNAYDLLTPYSKRNDNFGMKAAYKIGQLYEKQNRLSDADLKYKEISSRFSDKTMSEEAMYRRGEIYYNAAEYETSVTRFSEYQKKYPTGSFVDGSMYYTAVSYERSGNTERAILQYQALLKKFSESTYVYSTVKNLIELYRAKGEYSDALEQADFLLANYGAQAKSDGIGLIAQDLKKLSGGKSEAIVQKEAEFKANGELKTPEGRKSASELVGLYSQSPSYKSAAVSLAEKLVPEQKKHIPEESLFAAQNAEFLAKCYREQNRDKESANMYLLAAEYFRMNTKNSEAASCLYGAWDSFSAAGLAGDAKATAETLKNLYPDSREAKSIKL